MRQQIHEWKSDLIEGINILEMFVKFDTVKGNQVIPGEDDVIEMQVSMAVFQAPFFARVLIFGASR